MTDSSTPFSKKPPDRRRFLQRALALGHAHRLGALLDEVNQGHGDPALAARSEQLGAALGLNSTEIDAAFVAAAQL